MIGTEHTPRLFALGPLVTEYAVYIYSISDIHFPENQKKLRGAAAS